MQVNDALTSIQNLVSSLNTLKSTLNNTFNSTNNNNLKKNIDKSTDTITTLKKALNFGAVYLGLRKSWSIIKDVANANINMVETNNLFEVSMGRVVDQYGNLDTEASKYYIKAMAFQDEMNEKLATNKSELKQYQAMYFSMLKSQGINMDASYLMSESLTKAGYDIASLYNLTVDDAMNKLKSGLAGQVEPLRRIGIDISESSLKKVLNDVGIDRSVQELSYAEKEVARYIAIVNQAKQAQGDFARTFEQPANQIRVFKNEIAELKQVAGAFIVNTFGNILVYVNAVIMVIKEILKAFASLFGYDLNFSGTDISSASGINDLNDGLGSASKKAKELKKQLMGFDEINNIDPASKPSGGSGSGGTAGGVDQKLLDALKEWDNQMSGISGKAQEIRDKMLEWLGFERNDDGTWKLKEGLTNFEKILDVVKTIGIAMLTWKVSSTITGLLKALGVLGVGQAFKIAFGVTLALTGVYLLYKGIKHLLNGNVDIFTILETALGGALTTFGIVSILKGTITTIPLGNACKIGFGVTLALSGIFMEFNSVKKMLEGDISLGTILQGTGSAFLIGIGTWLITGNPVAGLIGTAGVLAFNLGVEIGMVLKQVDWEGIWEDITSACNTAWQVVVTFFTVEVPKWWNTNIAPWFTKEKWKGLGENAKKGLEEKWNEFVNWWTQTGFYKWWTENVSPYFKKETWEKMADNIKEAIKTKWNEFTNWWNSLGIVRWWNENVTPWFTKEKWSGEAGKSTSGIESKFNEWKSQFKPIENWFNEKVAPWLSWEKWHEIASNALQGLKNAFEGFSFPQIKTPHFGISYETEGTVAQAFKKMGLQGRPKIDVSWYANGGMPDMGEIFVANEAGAEMIGKIGNKTTVANNDQIVTAIKQGVYEAVVSAMPNGVNSVELNIRADEGIIVEKASQGFTDYVIKTGELPFPVPV